MTDDDRVKLEFEIDEDHHQELQRQAAALGVSPDELIESLIQQVMDDPEPFRDHIRRQLGKES